MMNCTIAGDRVKSKIHRDFVSKGSSMIPFGTSGHSISAMGKLSKRHINDPVFMDNEIHIFPTHQTPEFIFNTDGIIRIQGRGLYCDKPELCDQIISWIDGYLDSPAKTTYVTIAFEYLNSLSSSVLVSILRKLSAIIHQSKKLVVQWYYEADDDNILDRAKYISACCNIPMEFIVTNNVSRLKA